MAKRNTGRRGTRKRRPPSQPRRDGATAVADSSADDPVQGASATARGAPARPRRERRPSDSSAGSSSYRDPGSFGERPQSLWHPLPLSELLILVGAIGTLVGVLRGDGGPVLFAGLGAVLLGTLDFTIREHLAGYRAHTVMLAAMPTALLHAAVAVALYSLGAPRVSWIVVPLAVDVPVFWVIFRPLRARFEDARHRRVLELARR